jgi:hypothetical protein
MNFRSDVLAAEKSDRDRHANGSAESKLAMKSQFTNELSAGGGHRDSCGAAAGPNVGEPVGQHELL